MRKTAVRLGTGRLGKVRLGRAVRASVVVAGAGLLVTGCAVTPLKMGAAAVVGNQRISIATLDSEVTKLSEAARQYPGVVNLSSTEETQETLSWLVKFQVADELARQQGFSVSTAQSQAALASAYASAKSEAQEEGLSSVSLAEILALSGIAPNLSQQLGRYEAIQDEFVSRADGGKLPTATSAQTALSAKLTKATCTAAKALDIQVNPQFGRLSYSEIQVVDAPSTVTRTSGPAATPTSSATLSAC